MSNKLHSTAAFESHPREGHDLYGLQRTEYIAGIIVPVNASASPVDLCSALLARVFIRRISLI